MIKAIENIQDPELQRKYLLKDIMIQEETVQRFREKEHYDVNKIMKDMGKIKNEKFKIYKEKSVKLEGQKRTKHEQ